MKRFNRVMALLWLLGMTASADSGHDKTSPTSPTFAQMTQLVGTWKGTSNDRKGPQEAVVEYRLTSGGSALEEKLFAGTPHEMVSMYYEQNGQLQMTHYCMLGNHPHLTLKKASPKELRFVMASGSGIDMNAKHMHALKLEFVDATHLTQRWTCYENGKAADDVVITLTRVP